MDGATDEELLTEEQAAAWLRVSPEMLRHERLAGRVPYLRVDGQAVRYLRSQLLVSLAGPTRAD